MGIFRAAGKVVSGVVKTVSSVAGGVVSGVVNTVRNIAGGAVQAFGNVVGAIGESVQNMGPAGSLIGKAAKVIKLGCTGMRMIITGEIDIFRIIQAVLSGEVNITQVLRMFTSGQINISEMLRILDALGISIETALELAEAAGMDLSSVRSIMDMLAKLGLSLREAAALLESSGLSIEEAMQIFNGGGIPMEKAPALGKLLSGLTGVTVNTALNVLFNIGPQTPNSFVNDPYSSSTSTLIKTILTLLGIGDVPINRLLDIMGIGNKSIAWVFQLFTDPQITFAKLAEELGIAGKSYNQFFTEFDTGYLIEGKKYSLGQSIARLMEIGDIPVSELLSALGIADKRLNTILHLLANDEATFGKLVKALGIGATSLHSFLTALGIENSIGYGVLKTILTMLQETKGMPAGLKVEHAPVNLIVIGLGLQNQKIAPMLAGIGAAQMLKLLATMAPPAADMEDSVATTAPVEEVTNIGTEPALDPAGGTTTPGYPSAKGPEQSENQTPNVNNTEEKFVTVQPNPAKPHLACDFRIRIPQDFDRSGENAFITIAPEPKAHRYLIFSSKDIHPGQYFNCTVGGLSPDTEYTFEVSFSTPTQYVRETVTCMTTPVPANEIKTLLLVIDADLNSAVLEDCYDQYIQDIRNIEPQIEIKKYYLTDDLAAKKALYNYLQEAYVTENVYYLFFIGRNAALPLYVHLADKQGNTAALTSISSFYLYLNILNPQFEYNEQEHRYERRGYMNCPSALPDWQTRYAGAEWPDIAYGALLPPKKDIEDEEQFIKGYLTKLHNFRMGLFSFERRALYSDTINGNAGLEAGFTQTPRWKDNLALEANVRYYYAKLFPYDYEWEKDYLAALSTQSFELCYLHTHGFPASHQFHIDSADIAALPQMNTCFISLQSCSCGDFTKDNFIAATYLRQGSVLAVEAFTVPVMMVGKAPYMADFASGGYIYKIAQGQRFGDARRQAGSSAYSVLLADPLLSLDDCGCLTLTGAIPPAELYNDILIGFKEKAPLEKIEEALTKTELTGSSLKETLRVIPCLAFLAYTKGIMRISLREDLNACVVTIAAAEEDIPALCDLITLFPEVKYSRPEQPHH